jgi:hypothetical protein
MRASCTEVPIDIGLYNSEKPSPGDRGSLHFERRALEETSRSVVFDYSWPTTTSDRVLEIDTAGRTRNWTD